MTRTRKCTGPSPGRSRVSLAVVSAACIGAACIGAACMGFVSEQGRGPQMLAGSTQSTRGVDQPAKANPPAAQPITLQFEIPPEFSNRAADGSYVVLGFRVGYFRPDEPKFPLSSSDFRRAAIVLNGQTARLTFRTPSLPEDVKRIVLRIQTLSYGVTSAWSDATAPVTMPIKAAPTRKSKSASRQRPQGLTPADLEKHPALQKALGDILSPDVQIKDALGGFRHVEGLALAVAICRRYDLPFAELQKALHGPPSQPLGQALRQMRPSLDRRRAIRQARDDAQRLLARSKAKTP